MAKTNAQDWDLYLRDELGGLIHPEDGSEYTYAVFYVVAAADNGRQFGHKVHFHSAETFEENTEDGWYGGIANHLEATREKAQRFLERIQAAQKAGAWKGPLDNDYWEEIEPVYGSDAYIDAEPMLVAAERAREKGEMI